MEQLNLVSPPKSSETPQKQLKNYLQQNVAYQTQKSLERLKNRPTNLTLEISSILEQKNSPLIELKNFDLRTGKTNEFEEEIETKTQEEIQILQKPKQAFKPYFLDQNFCLYQNDCVEIMKSMPDNYVDMIFADPPYFLSEKDKSRQPTNFPLKGTNYKGEWDVSSGFEKNFRFHQEWIKQARRILKPEGTMWITGTHHSIYKCTVALQSLDFKILNEISWYKPRSKYYTKSYFNFSHEGLIWARKSQNPTDKHYFNSQLMSKWRGDPLKDSNPEDRDSMRTVWQIDPPSKKEYATSRHPTQKPIQLLQRIILASTKPNAIILDPFSGSGTTGIAVESIGLNRKYIGIEKETEYLEITKRRLAEIRAKILEKRGK